MKNSYLIDLVKEEFGLKTDTELAYVLGEKQPIVAGWRTERRPIPVSTKLRLCDHIKLFKEIQKVVDVFGDRNEHEVNLTQDMDRLEELKKKQAGVPVNFVDMKWIDRVSKLQKTHKLSDEQVAKYLGLSNEKLLNIKNGNEELSMVTKVALLSCLTGGDYISSDYLKKNLNKRIKNDQA
jgi:hypothetical protein